MNELDLNTKKFALQVTQGVQNCLETADDKLKLVANRHYFFGGRNSSRVLTLYLQRINPRHLSKIQSLRHELSMFAGLSNDNPIRIGYRNQAIFLEVSKPEALWRAVTIEDMLTKRLFRPGQCATLGIDIEDKPAEIDFGSGTTASCMVVGETGSGKTNTLNVLAWNVVHNTTPDQANILIVDPSKNGLDWQGFANVPHLAHPIVTDFDNAIGVVGWASQQIEQRKDGRTYPSLYVFIDEVRDLARFNPAIIDVMSRIASLGRQFKIFLVWGTQYPKIQQLGKGSDELKDNSNVTLIGRVSSAANAANAIGIPDSGAENLAGKGDFLLKKSESSSLTRLTVAKLEARHFDLLERGQNNKVVELDKEAVYRGMTPKKRPQRQPDELSPEQVAVALLKPMGINKLAERFGIGSDKARRAISFADAIRQWAIANNALAIPASC